jgi:hypothetical protein
MTIVLHPDTEIVETLRRDRPLIRKFYVTERSGRIAF